MWQKTPRYVLVWTLNKLVKAAATMAHTSYSSPTVLISLVLYGFVVWVSIIQGKPQSLQASGECVHAVTETFIEQRPIKPHILPQFVIWEDAKLKFTWKIISEISFTNTFFFNLHVLGGSVASAGCYEGVTTLQTHPGRPGTSWTW